MTKNKIKKYVLTGSAVAAIGILVPTTVVACSSDSNNSNDAKLQQIVNEINLNQSITKANQEGNVVLPSAVTDTNIINYININSLPNNGNEISYGFAVLNKNDDAGTLELQIKVMKTKDSNDYLLSNKITIKDFLTTQNFPIYNELYKITQNIKIKNADIAPESITSNNIDQYIDGIQNNGNGNGISTKIEIENASNKTGNIEFKLTGTQDSTKNTFSISIVLTGLKSQFSSEIESLKLKVNPSFAVPQNTTSPLSFENSWPIFANFDLTLDQIKNLKNIDGLTISVSNSNYTTGTATLEFTKKYKNETTALLNKSSVSITYDGFFKETNSTASSLQKNIENYFKDSITMKKWLDNFLSINPNWINSFVQNNIGNANFFNEYQIYNSTFQANDFTTTSATNGLIQISAKLMQPLNIQQWYPQPSGPFKNLNGVLGNTKVTINLPFLFGSATTSNGDKPTTVNMNIEINSTGQVTLSWPVGNNQLDFDNTTTGIFFELGANKESKLLPFTLFGSGGVGNYVNIASIVF